MSRHAVINHRRCVGLALVKSNNSHIHSTFKYYVCILKNALILFMGRVYVTSLIMKMFFTTHGKLPLLYMCHYSDEDMIMSMTGKEGGAKAPMRARF